MLSRASICYAIDTKQWLISCDIDQFHQKEYPMNRQLISSGSIFEAQIGYSRAVVAGDWVMVSGTTGFDYASMAISDDVVEQAEQCLQNIDTALRQAGSGMADVVRVTYVRPAAMMISAGLADPRMKIEIEVTALKRTALTAVDSA